MVSRLRSLLLLGLLPVLGGCGAGVVAGVLANGDDPPNSGPPSLSLPSQALPLVPTPGAALRTVVVANSQLSPQVSLEVQIRAQGVVANQDLEVILSGQGASTVIGFVLRTEPIVQLLGAGADVAADMVVRVDGLEVAPPLAVTLLRQPTLRLFDGAPLFVSPLGGDRIRLAASGLRSTEATSIQVSVTTADATGVAPFVTRVCLRPEFAVPGPLDPPLQTGEVLVTAEVPGNTFSGPTTFLIDDFVAGRSSGVDGAYYHPELTVALPPQGSTRGGSKVTLIGRALAPLVPSGPAGKPDFDQVQLRFRKGGREVVMSDGALLREESTLDRLVFTMPPSPDGRAGNVSIVLRARIDGPQPGGVVDAEIADDDLFLFANPEPVFGPRGTVLDREPVAVAPLELEGAPNSTQATDFAVLYSEGGFGALQLLMSQENGMFIRAGPTRRIGDPEVATEREPRDLLTADFDGDHVPDMLIVNAGDSSRATLHIVRGQPAPAAPLGGVVRFLIDYPGMARGRVGDFDRDGALDVLLVPGDGAPSNQRPIVMMSRPSGGTPSFAPPVELPVRAYRYDAFDVADFDGDGLLDVAVVAGRLLQKLDVAYGDGFGGFVAGMQFDFTVPYPNYAPDAASPAVGLHAMGPPPCSLVIVLSGLPPVPPGASLNPATPPLIVLSRASSARTYSPLQAADVMQQTGAIDPFRTSLAANLDGLGVGRDELVVGASGAQAQFAVGMFRLGGTGRLSVIDVVDFKPKEPSALFAGIAFPADALRNQPEAPAVFVKHEITVDGNLERRLSTLLVGRSQFDLVLLPPDVGFRVALQGVIGGSFSATGIASGGATRDVALPSGQKVLLADNNGFGALAKGNEMAHSGLVPETTTRVPAPAGVADALVFIDDGTRDGRTDGVLRIGLWRHDPSGPNPQLPTSFSTDLRELFGPPLALGVIDPSSRLQAADVDGDGITDLTVLLRFVLRRQEGDALLMVLRGKQSPANGEFPFEMPEPEAITPVHGNATMFALGDFAPDGSTAPVRQELALAVPAGSTSTSGDGDHLRFYRLAAGETPSHDSWVRSFAAGGAQVLVAGNAPTRLAVADYDRNDTADLLVACDGDASLRLFLNSGQPAADPRQVVLENFHESLGSPMPTTPGRHTHLLLGDINGDGNVDALLATESTRTTGTTAELTTAVAFYLSSGTGEFSIPTYVSPTRLGDRDAHLSLDLGDINSDGVPDLSLGWHQAGDGGDNHNLRVLLGGSR